MSIETYEPNYIKWADTSYAYFKGDLTIDDVVSEYRTWVKQPTYAIGYQPDYTKPLKHHPIESRQGYQNHWCKYRAFKVAKRGNDVYRYQVRKRFKPLIDLCTLQKDFRFIPENARTANANIFMITLTYDTKLTTLNNAWLNIGKDLNAFLSNLKRDFGKIQVLRCFESFKKKSNYPHVHLILRLDETTLPCFRYTNKEGKTSYRVTSSKLNKIEKHWHSYIQMVAVTSMGGIGYLLKYITKEMYTKDDFNTVGMLWLFHKQAYSISYNFTYKIGEDVDTIVLNSTQLDLMVSNSNSNYADWTYLCTKTTEFPLSEWHFKIKPPPELDATPIDGEISDCFDKIELEVEE